MKDKELVRFYFDTMSLNEHLHQWYRAVFVAFDAGFVLAMAFAIMPQGSDQSRLLPAVFVLVILGLIVSFFWVWITCQRANIVEIQKTKIKEIVRREGNEDLADCFKIYQFPAGKYLPESIFNVGLPIIVGFLLIFMLNWFANVCLISCIAMAAIFFTLSMLAKFIFSRVVLPDGTKSQDGKEGQSSFPTNTSPSL